MNSQSPPLDGTRRAPLFDLPGQVAFVKTETGDAGSGEWALPFVSESVQHVPRWWWRARRGKVSAALNRSPGFQARRRRRNVKRRLGRA